VENVERAALYKAREQELVARGKEPVIQEPGGKIFRPVEPGFKGGAVPQIRLAEKQNELGFPSGSRNAQTGQVPYELAGVGAYAGQLSENPTGIYSYSHETALRYTSHV